MRRFFISPEDVADGRAVLRGDLCHHMTKVLRLSPGTPVILCDGTGTEHAGTITEIGRETVIVTISETFAASPSSGPRITLYQGLPKGERLDFVLQKGTELGAAAIVPFAATRSVVRIDGKNCADKTRRWQKIVQEAARQSGRESVPAVSWGGDLGSVVSLAQHDLRLILWEQESESSLKSRISLPEAPASVGVLVGPEGGFTAEEVLTAKNAGFLPVSLGRRILRTETAALAILAILQFHWGDLG